MHYKMGHFLQAIVPPFAKISFYCNVIYYKCLSLVLVQALALLVAFGVGVGCWCREW